MLTVVPDLPAPRSRPALEVMTVPAIVASGGEPSRGARTVASDAGVNDRYSALAWVSDDGRWWVCREERGPTQFAELVALASAVRHHPKQRLRVLTDLDCLADLVSDWRAGGVHRWPSMRRYDDARLKAIVSVLQRRVAARAGRHDEVTAKHVRGHSGHPLNTAADRLARHALTSGRIDRDRCQRIVNECLGTAPPVPPLPVGPPIGHPSTRLIVVHGGDASERFGLGAAVRERYGPSCALISQDDLSHLVLGDDDRLGGDLATQVAAFALDAGRHVLCEGSWLGARGRRALSDLARRHRGTTTAFRLGVGGAALYLPDDVDVAEQVLERDTDDAVEALLRELCRPHASAVR